MVNERGGWLSKAVSWQKLARESCESACEGVGASSMPAYTDCARCALSFSRRGVMSSSITRLISMSLVSFFSIVSTALRFFVSNMRVPAASSIIPRISMGLMLSTLVMRPCMMRKCGLFTLSWTEWNKFCTRCSCALCPLIIYLLRPPIAICGRGQMDKVACEVRCCKRCGFGCDGGTG